MVATCCATGCTNRKWKGCTTTFHSFPRDPERRKAWVDFLKRETFVPTIHSKLCSDHFVESDFNQIKFGGTWLNVTAVPSVLKKQRINETNEQSLENIKVINAQSLEKQIKEETNEQSLENIKVINAQSLEKQIKEETNEQSLTSKESLEKPKNEETNGQSLTSEASTSTNRDISDESSIPNDEKERNEQVSLSIKRSLSDKDEHSDVDEQVSYPAKKTGCFRYVGDVKKQVLLPSNSKRIWDIVEKQINQQRKTIKILHQKNRRLIKRNAAYKTKIEDLERRLFYALSENNTLELGPQVQEKDDES